MRTKINKKYLSLGFKWAAGFLRKPKDEVFTVDDYKKCIEMVISQLPEDLEVQEITIESNLDDVGKYDHDLETKIYWKEPK